MGEPRIHTIKQKKNFNQSDQKKNFYPMICFLVRRYAFSVRCYANLVRFFKIF